MRNRLTVTTASRSGKPIVGAQVDLVAGPGKQSLGRTQHVNDVGMGDAVANLSTISFVDDEPAVLQASKVARDVGLCPAHHRDDLGHSLLATGQRCEDRQSRLVAEPVALPRRLARAS